MPCSICNGKYNARLAVSDPPICLICYQKQNIKTGFCSKCNENDAFDIQFNQKEQISICRKCRCKFYRRKEEICYVCNKNKEVKTRNTLGQAICDTCYKKTLQPKKICFYCSQLKITNNIDENDNSICKDCYKAWRKTWDKNYSTLQKLRDRLRNALKIYSKSGKCKNSNEYGINYVAIIEYLGPCPGNRSDYHIDHIKPLCLFDLNDSEQIKLAFAPENHQWLLKEENLKKGKNILGVKNGNN